MKNLIKTGLFIFLGFCRATLLGILTALVFFVPFYLIGFVVEAYFWSRSFDSIFEVTMSYPISFVLGTAVMVIVYVFVSIDFYKMYQDKAVDKASLDDFPAKLVMLVIGLSGATYLGLMLLSIWEPTLLLYAGGDVTEYSIFMLVLEHLSKGIFFDVFEVFEVKLTTLKHNTDNFVFCAYLVFFRILTSGLFLAFVVLKYREFKDPNWHRDYRAKRVQTASE